eukprot:TRINITY_DN17250_c0_g1_i2.p1 TRINITY_DN17250_c0_g1~~TRINITY_DN17250_c0_g1_i2.p1  ORF type:complete len:209 (+),score=71.85 TRINITY_DN17250_c0_g1_i2:133-759(+)
MIARQLAEKRAAQQAAALAAQQQASEADEAKEARVEEESTLSESGATENSTEAAARPLSDKSNTDGPSMRELILQAKKGQAKKDLGECAICKKVVEARRDLKTLPCKHSFHYSCIEDFHRRKLSEEKDTSLPCFICGAATNKSIASVMEERKKAKEDQAAEEARAAKEKEEREAAERRSKVAAAANARRNGGRSALSALAEASRNASG